ncbi:proline-rich putative variable surface lipoprotein [[Mycoplasma] phocae]|uniref:Proline-rich putative variable surface lipoprotein n=1 Tax=[Mycoplasma] phocae TaxID=142651 RepID=A0A2Z5IPV3_9BACT|nr:proline-rich putative variable surface lipoprotein [[Mycoplasma] phocae]
MNGVSGFIPNIVDSIQGIDITNEKFFIAKIEIKKGNEKKFEVYVKFAGIKATFTTEDEYKKLIANKNKELTEILKNANFEYIGELNDKTTIDDLNKNIIVTGKGTNIFVKKVIEKIVDKNKKLVFTRITLTKDKFVKSFYVEFAFNNQNSSKVMGIKLNTKEIFDKLGLDKNERKEKNALQTKLESAKFEYTGTLKKASDFNLNKVEISDKDFVLREAVVVYVNDKEIVSKIITQNKNKKYRFIVYVKFTISNNGKVLSEMITWKTFNEINKKIKKEQEKIQDDIEKKQLELESSKFEYKEILNNINNFNLNMINISNNSFIVDQNKSKKILAFDGKSILVKLVTKNDGKEFIIYLEFSKNSNNKYEGIKITQSEFEQGKLLP